MTNRNERLSIACQVACLAVIGILNFGPLLGVSYVANSIISILAAFAFTTLHGRMAMGWKHLGIFAGITILVSFTSEAVGVATGWIFGNYHYTDHLGPQIFGVPPLIQAGYISMGYASLIIARAILGMLRTPNGWGGPIVAVCTALIMVAWDVVMDPYQSTVSGDWVWRDGGPYFGVPLHNYAGWFGTVFVLTLLYMFYERANPLRSMTGVAARKWFWTLPVINYGLLAFGIMITPLVGGVPDPMAAPQNYAGTSATLQYSLALIAVFAMGTPVVLALARLIHRDEC